jgi:hydrogenase expression/formation protein HypE
MNHQRTYRPRLDLRAGRIDMTHGSGGRATAQLFEEIFLPAFANPHLERAEDQATLKSPDCRLAVTTDGHVVTPLFFPGGDIGSLSIHGTINDLAVGGARPLHITAGFVIEEGFPLTDLKRIADSMGEAARRCGVVIVAGDTKVVERGKADGVFITTTGIGEVPDGLDLGAHRIRAGDKVILSGPIGDHGIAILSKRENLTFDAPVESDSAPLHELVAAMLEAAPGGIRAMRDATRGGLAAIMNEYAHAAHLGFALDEESVPVRPAVNAACELLGIDPLYVANEGKLVAVVAPDAADAVLAAMRAHPQGAEAAIVGEAIEDQYRFVRLETSFGGGRVVDWLSGDQLPRIC